MSCHGRPRRGSAESRAGLDRASSSNHSMMAVTLLLWFHSIFPFLSTKARAQKGDPSAAALPRSKPFPLPPSPPSDPSIDLLLLLLLDWSTLGNREGGRESRAACTRRNLGRVHLFPSPLDRCFAGLLQVLGTSSNTSFRKVGSLGFPASSF